MICGKSNDEKDDEKTSHCDLIVTQRSKNSSTGICNFFLLNDYIDL